MSVSIECAHCKSKWTAAENCILVLADGNKGCTFCTSDSGMRALGERAHSLRYHNMDVGDDPLAKQVGGDHYKTMKIQPVEFIEANGIPFLEGNVIKYVVRHVGKGGVADLRKAKHYIDLLLKLRYQETP